MPRRWPKGLQSPIYGQRFAASISGCVELVESAPVHVAPIQDDCHYLLGVADVIERIGNSAPFQVAALSASAGASRAFTNS